MGRGENTPTCWKNRTGVARHKGSISRGRSLKGTKKPVFTNAITT